MRRDDVGIWAPWIGAEGRVVAYGHWGRPLLAFPSEQGSRWDYESNGMLAQIAWLIDAGRVKVYSIDSFDAGSWRRDDLPLEQRAQLGHRHLVARAEIDRAQQDDPSHRRRCPLRSASSRRRSCFVGRAPRSAPSGRDARRSDASRSRSSRDSGVSS